MRAKLDENLPSEAAELLREAVGSATPSTTKESRAQTIPKLQTGDTFELADGCGYLVSRVPVKPLRVHVVEDTVAAVLKREVELRVQQCLWALRDAVVESTLAFSIIRWRNAAPRRAA